MNKKPAVLISFFLIAFTISALQFREDVVPNETIAIQMTEKEWLIKYGEGIYTKKPFKAILGKDSIWHVFGTLKPIEIHINEDGDSTIQAHFGGVPHIFLDKRTGKILNCYHSK